MNLSSVSCPEGVELQEFAAYLLPYLDVLASRNDEQGGGTSDEPGKTTDESGEYAAKNETFNYEELFGNEVKTLNECLDEIISLLTIVLGSYSTIIYLVDEEKSKLKIYNQPSDKITQSRVQDIETGKTVAAFVAKRKQYIMLNSKTIDDERFPLGNEDIQTKSLLCVPILKPDEELTGVIECYRIFPCDYDTNDLHTLTILMIWIGAIMDQKVKRESLQAIQDLHAQFMSFLQEYFTKDVQIDQIIYKIFDCTKRMVGAERGFVAVTMSNEDPLCVDIFDEIPGKQIMKLKKYNLDPERGCASFCMRERRIVNLITPDRKVYDLELDRYIGTPTNCILCLPIMDKNNVLGCIQLFNKTGGGTFDEADEHKIGHILVYYSLLLHGVRMDKKISQNNDSNRIMREMLSHELNKLVTEAHIDEFITVPDDFDSHSFHAASPSDMPTYCFYIFRTLIAPKYFDREKYYKFILIVHRNYRPNPFHNFEMLFLSFHCVYIILKANLKNFDPCEVIAILITALCYCVENRGLTNSYFAMTKHPLHSLYNGHSCWQNHSMWLTREIIRHLDMFDCMNDEEIKQIDEILENGFLALDYTNGVKSINKLGYIVKSKAFHWNTPAHRTLVHILILYAGEVVTYTKGFEVARQSIENLLKEHINEGKLLQAHGKASTLIIDGSRKHEIPDQEIIFLKTICIPVYELCETLLVGCDELLIESKNLLKIVEDMIAMRGIKVWYPDESFARFNL